MRAKEFTEDISRRGFLGGIAGAASGVRANPFDNPNPETFRRLHKEPEKYNPWATEPARSSATASKPSSEHVVSWEEIDKYLHRLGLDKIKRVGILNNIDSESKFNVSAYRENDRNGPSGGLFQHHDNIPRNEYRFTNMTKHVPDWQTNWKGQINYALSEPEGKKYIGMNFNNVEAATHYWTTNFENPAHAEREARLRAKNSRKFGV